MHDRPVRTIREQALADAEAALVERRRYHQQRIEALPLGATQEQADAWARQWPPRRATEVEEIVDAVLASVPYRAAALKRLDFLQSVLDRQRHLTVGEVQRLRAEIAGLQRELGATA